MAQNLIESLDDEEPSLRQAAHNCLVALADGDAPAAAAMEEPDPEHLARQWRDHWYDFEQKNVLGPRADSFLAMGETLEDIGQPQKAAERYRRILNEFPDTPAAYTARKRLKAMGRN
jgi:hypothetical protein